MRSLSRRKFIALTGVSCVLVPAVSAEEGRELDFNVEVTINGQGVPVVRVSGGEPRDEGRRRETGAIIHDEVTPLTLGSDSEGMKEILELIEEAISARRGPVIEVIRETRAGKMTQRYIGADPGSVEANELSEEVSLKPLRLELNA